MSNFDSFTEFARAIDARLPDVWGVEMDELCLKQTNGTQVGYQRDDLYRWMVVMPIDEEWPPDSVYAYLPDGIDQIADRPGVPSVQIKPVTVSAVISAVESHAPDYEGKFEYDE